MKIKLKIAAKRQTLNLINQLKQINLESELPVAASVASEMEHLIGLIQ